MRSSRTLFIIVALISLGAVLRLGQSGLTEFKRDEAQLYMLALDVATGRHWPLRGLGSSVGIPNFPLSIYLFALPLLIGKNPLLATLFVGAMNTLAVALTASIAQRYWGRRVAMIATALYTTAPWAIIYSRKIWAQNLLPLIVVAYIFSGLLTFVEGRQRWLVAHLALLALAVQLHFSALALIPLTLGCLIVYRRQVRRGLLCGGLALGGATLLPFLRYCATHWPSVINSSLALTNTRWHFHSEALQLAALVSTGAQTHSLAGPTAFRDFLLSVPYAPLPTWLSGVLLISGCGYMWYQALRRPSSSLPRQVNARLILLAWLCLPPLIFLIIPTPPYPHYFIILLPAPYLVTAIFLEAITNRLPAPWATAARWTPTVIIVATQTAVLLSLLKFVENRYTPGGFGTPLKMLRHVATVARNADNAILIVSAGTDPGIDEIPTVFAALLPNQERRYIDGNTTAVFPAQAATVVLWPGNYPAAQAYRRWATHNRWTSHEIPLRQGEGIVSVIDIPAASPLPTPPYPRNASALLSNGAELLGSGGDEHRWELWWRVATLPADEVAYHVFAHALDEQGAKVAQVDEATYATPYWRRGDVVINYFELENHAGVSVTRAGMYTWPDLTPITILDAAGNPAGEWLLFAAPTAAP